MASAAATRTVAVDVNPATRAIITGTELFTREVARRLPAAAPELRWRFLASRPKKEMGVDALVLPFPRMWSQVRLPLHLAAERPDLLFVPGHVVPFGWLGPALTVVHDLAFERYPNAYSPADRAYLQLSTRWAIARSRFVITVSESTRQDLVELYRVSPERIRVVPLGIAPPSTPVAPAARLKELGLNGKFVLQVGRVEPRKNQAAALSAVERLNDVTLVVAGPVRDPALAASLRRSDRCRVLGAVDQPTLELLYARASVVVVPSLYEGFGLPVLEAMARGNVVVSARNSSLPEVGGDVALYFGGSSGPEEIAGVLDVALHDAPLRARLKRAARKRAAGFTWDKTAEGVAAVIRESLST